MYVLQQGGDSGDELDEEFAYADRSKEKLVWVDALNKWLPQKQVRHLVSHCCYELAVFIFL